VPEDVAIAEVLTGHRIAPLPERQMVIGAAMLIKVMDEHGKIRWVVRHTADSFNDVELIGAMVVQLDRLQASFTDGWEPDEEDE
jgi:hypothetical protein